MESSYGIGVKNRYAIFIGDEEEDPLDTISKSGPNDKTIKTDNKTEKRSVKALNESKISNVNHQNIIKDNKTQKDSINKPKTNDNSLSKTKDITPKSDSNRTPRQKTDRIQRNRDPNQTGDRVNNFNDRPNRPPRPSNEPKDMEELKNQKNREQDRFGGNTETRDRRERSDSDRRGGRNGRGNGDRRRRFGNGEPERRGKRDLDRHSGSDKAGVKAVEKREGGGAHNWGKFNDFGADGETFDGEKQELTDRSADETQLDVNDSNQENDANLSEETKEVVEGPKEMTLEEYKQQLEEKRVQPKFNLRKPGEGEDNTQWKKTFVLKKKVEDEEDEVEYEEIEVEEERKGRHKQVLDIEINFRDEGRDFPRRGDGRRGGRERRDRGERGGDRERADRPERTDRGERERRGERSERGGPPRGGPRTDRPYGDRNRTRRPPKEQTAPKVDDWNDFPSLAAA